MINDFSFGYTVNGIPGNAPPSDSIYYRKNSGITLPMIFPNADPIGLVPNFTYGGVAGWAGASGNQPTRFAGLPYNNRNPVYNITDNVTKLKGNHTIKFGIYYEFAVKSENPFRALNGNIDFSRDANNPGDTNHPFANALLGNFRSFSQTSASLLPEYPYTQVEWFAQDTWKVNRKLTLNYGLRQAYIQPLYDKGNQMANFSFADYSLSKRVQLAAEFPPDILDRLGGKPGDHILSQDRSRYAAQRISADAARLILQFREPARILDAILACADETGEAPGDLLEGLERRLAATAVEAQPARPVLHQARAIAPVLVLGLTPVDEAVMPYAEVLWYGLEQVRRYEGLLEEACLEADVPFLPLLDALLDLLGGKARRFGLEHAQQPECEERRADTNHERAGESEPDPAAYATEGSDGFLPCVFLHRLVEVGVTIGGAAGAGAIGVCHGSMCSTPKARSALDEVGQPELQDGRTSLPDIGVQRRGQLVLGGRDLVGAGRHADLEEFTALVGLRLRLAAGCRRFDLDGGTLDRFPLGIDDLAPDNALGKCRR